MTDGQSVVGGRYRLQERVGRGGMAEVYRGLDLRLGRPVAVKLLNAALSADETAQTRFRREAQSAASLNDPAIASVHDTGEDVDPATGAAVPYIVMELVEGQTLRDLLASGPLPTHEALRITRSVLDALDTSHAAGIVHRDIKPANVMVTPTGNVKVMDFGIARAVDDTSSHLTQTSAVIGTAHYLSPEQARGEAVDLRSDLYSVGCLLFELLTGRPPFVGETSISVAYQHVREEPVPPSEVRAGLPPALDAVVLHALAKDPGDRYPSARAMRSDIEHVLAQPEESAVPTRLAATLPAATLAAPREPDHTQLAASAGGPTTAVAVAPVPTTDPEERRRRGLGRLLLVSTGLLLVLGLGAFGLLQLLGPSDAATTSVAVPKLTGSTRTQAESLLRDADLVPRFREVRGKAGKTVDTVVEQRPAAGESVVPGADVTVEVNVGPASGTVPDDLVGEDLDKVREELADAGFTEVKVEPVVSPSAGLDAGEVVSLDPGEGERGALDEPVVVRYADGGDDGAGAAARTGGGSGKNGSGDRSDQGNDGADGGKRADDQQQSTRSPEPSPSSEPSSTDEPTTSASPEPDPEPSGSARSSASARPTTSAAPEPSATSSSSEATIRDAGQESTEKPQ